MKQKNRPAKLRAIFMKVVCIVLLNSLSGMVRGQVVIALLFGDKLNTDQLEFGLVVSPVLTNITAWKATLKWG
jgi:hypothetical protein